MAALGGTTVISPIRPSDSNDTYPSHEAIYGKGGFRSVDSIAARDAIPSARREAGMLVAVNGGDTFAWNGTDWVQALLTPEQVQALVDAVDAYSKAETDNLLSSKSDVGHEHLEADIVDLDKYTKAEVDALIAAASGAPSAGIVIFSSTAGAPAGTLPLTDDTVQYNREDYPALEQSGSNLVLEGSTADLFRLKNLANKFLRMEDATGNEGGQDETDLSHTHDVTLDAGAAALLGNQGVADGTYTTDSGLGLHDNRPAFFSLVPCVIADPAAYLNTIAGGGGGVTTDNNPRDGILFLDEVIDGDHTISERGLSICPTVTGQVTVQGKWLVL